MSQTKQELEEADMF